MHVLPSQMQLGESKTLPAMGNDLRHSAIQCSSSVLQLNLLPIINISSIGVLSTSWSSPELGRFWKALRLVLGIFWAPILFLWKAVFFLDLLRALPSGNAPSQAYMPMFLASLWLYFTSKQSIAHARIHGSLSTYLEFTQLKQCSNFHLPCFWSLALLMSHGLSMGYSQLKRWAGLRGRGLTHS